MHITEQAIEQAIGAAPSMVRQVVEDDAKISDITFELGKRHSLRADALGVLFDCTRAMLVGLVSPQEVVADLKMVGVAETTAREILADLNEQLFMPLRTEMQKVGVQDNEEKAAVPAPSTPPAPVTQVPVPSYIAPPLQSPRYVHEDGPISITTVTSSPQVPAPSPTSAPVPPSAPQAQVEPAAPLAPAPVTHTASTLLPSGEAEARPMLPVAEPAQVPAPEEKPASAPDTRVVEPPAAPAAEAPAPAPVAPARPVAAAPARPAPAAPAPTRPYSADPYREPIEG